MIQELCQSLESSLTKILPLLEEIRPSSIFLLGLQLNVPLAKLRVIETQYKDDLGRQKMEIIIYWLENSKDCSWMTLAEAVKSLGGHDQLASKLKKLKDICLPEAESNQPGASRM